MGVKIKPKKRRLSSPCDFCKRRAKAKHECITCDWLKKDGKTDAIFTVHACGHHQEEGMAKIRKHALVAHPINLIRAAIAALKGEDVF